MHRLSNGANNFPTARRIFANVSQHALSLTKLKILTVEAMMKLVMTPPPKGTRSKSTIQHLLPIETMDQTKREIKYQSHSSCTYPEFSYITTVDFFSWTTTTG
ncbi:hypothetical protein BofuT4_P153500.1 [Botrytis cinerea T4]|uniref:Uncharacterized protein n=1 Tax=Botryotinia fuckeliana (strain T4) TaxID=999810 RepID=G2YVZ0_BOTF4|nr:hypothetical protein BofuT4_P153500.1 [Botrytis cinerea T4]